MTIMRPIRTIATALPVASLATAGCGTSQPDQPTTPPSQPPVVTAPPHPRTRIRPPGPRPHPPAAHRVGDHHPRAVQAGELPALPPGPAPLPSASGPSTPTRCGST